MGREHVGESRGSRAVGDVLDEDRGRRARCCRRQGVEDNAFLYNGHGVSVRRWMCGKLVLALTSSKYLLVSWMTCVSARASLTAALSESALRMSAFEMFIRSATEETTASL